MDEDMVEMWTMECLEPIKDQIDQALLIAVMSKIMWAITQAYQSGFAHGEDAHQHVGTAESPFCPYHAGWGSGPCTCGGGK